MQWYVVWVDGACPCDEGQHVHTFGDERVYVLWLEYYYLRVGVSCCVRFGRGRLL